MIVTLQTQRVQTLEQVRRVAEGNEPVDFTLAERASAYEFIRRTLTQFDYAALGKADKGAVKAYLGKMTGLSRAQLTRLIAQHRSTGRIRDRRGAGPSRPFTRRYTAADIRLLAEVDAALGQRCGPATRAVLRRQYELFGDARFVRLAGLSNGHLYNLRASRTYRTRRSVFTRTRARVVAIGERRKPRPDGQPGWLRVDTVHQGDRDGTKGVYYVNTVDEVTQYEHIGCVPAISERFLVPVLEALIRAYPFEIRGFHADNGSEYINPRVAALLNKLRASHPTPRPVDLWTSPADRREPFGPCGQPVDNADALPTACPHSRASRPQAPQGSLPLIEKTTPHTIRTLVDSRDPPTHHASSHPQPDFAPPTAHSRSSFRLISGLENTFRAPGERRGCASDSWRARGRKRRLSQIGRAPRPSDLTMGGARSPDAGWRPPPGPLCPSNAASPSDLSIGGARPDPAAHQRGDA